MKKIALAAALAVCGAVHASMRLRSRTVGTPSGSVRLTIPRAFEHLRPGSVYPDRRRPVEPRGCPVAIVERGLLSEETREFFLERGFVVADAPRETLDNPPGLINALATESAVDVSRSIVLCRRFVPESLAPRIQAAAILDPSAESNREIDPLPVELFLLSPAREPSDALTEQLRGKYGNGCVEKWYRSDNGYPREAFRDAAEWLAIQAAR